MGPWWIVIMMVIVWSSPAIALLKPKPKPERRGLPRAGLTLSAPVLTHLNALRRDRMKPPLSAKGFTYAISQVRNPSLYLLDDWMIYLVWWVSPAGHFLRYTQPQLTITEDILILGD